MIAVLALALALVVQQGAQDDPSATAPTSTTTAGPGSTLGPTTVGSTPGSPDATSPTSDTASTTPLTTATSDAGARALLAGLRVAAVDPSLPDYRRADFGDGWAYDHVTGCNTRERVLADESLAVPIVDDRCKPLSGRWVSLYDGVATSTPADLEIDHLVPLAEAWRSGAATWTPDRRLAFANDLSDPNTLVAVTSRTNRSKSDSPPQDWLPPDPGARCPYVQRWVEVKARWDLSVTTPEKATLATVLAGC